MSVKWLNQRDGHEERRFEMPRYSMTSVEGNYMFQFFCACCEDSYTTGLIKADSADKALRLAWEEAARHFNGCRECGKFVCDKHYNMAEFKCVKCAPCSNKSVFRHHFPLSNKGMAFLRSTAK